MPERCASADVDMPASLKSQEAAEQAAERLGPVLGEAYGLRGLRLDRVIPTKGRNVSAILIDEESMRYVARCHLRNPNPARIDFQLAFQRHLRANGLPAPDILRADTGEQWTEIDGMSWVLFEHIDGRPYDFNDRDQLTSATHMLGRFHEAGATFKGTSVKDDTIPDLRRWWIRGAEDIEELRTMFAGRDVDDELDFLDRWHARMTRELPLDEVDRLPTAWLHADYHGDNLAFRDREVVGIFDFDVVNHGWRLDDIARAIYHFATPPGSDIIDPVRADAFVEAVGLNHLERAALPYFMAAVHVRVAARYGVREREGGDVVNVLRHHVNRMRLLDGVRVPVMTIEI